MRTLEAKFPTACLSGPETVMFCPLASTVTPIGMAISMTLANPMLRWSTWPLTWACQPTPTMSSFFS